LRFKGNSDQSRIFVHDAGQIVLDFEKTGTGAAGVTDLTHRYLWGSAVDQIPADEAVDDGTPDDVAWALTDHLNSVRDLVEYNPGSDTTSVIKHVTYDAFGNLTSDSASAVASLFLFTARPYDADTNLQNNLKRWYDPATGRWISTDPIGFGANLRSPAHAAMRDRVLAAMAIGANELTRRVSPHAIVANSSPSQNLYTYARNAPLSQMDPLGLRDVCVLQNRKWVGWNLLAVLVTDSISLQGAVGSHPTIVEASHDMVLEITCVWERKAVTSFRCSTCCWKPAANFKTNSCTETCPQLWTHAASVNGQSIFVTGTSASWAPSWWPNGIPSPFSLTFNEKWDHPSDGRRAESVCYHDKQFAKPFAEGPGVPGSYTCRERKTYTSHCIASNCP
jgi:RHS repeat-associated protein